MPSTRCHNTWQESSSRADRTQELAQIRHSKTMGTRLFCILLCFRNQPAFICFQLGQILQSRTWLKSCKWNTQRFRRTWFGTSTCRAGIPGLSEKVLASWLQQIVACEKDFDISGELSDLVCSTVDKIHQGDLALPGWCACRTLGLYCASTCVADFVRSLRLWVWGLQWQHYGHASRCRSDRSWPWFASQCPRAHPTEPIRTHLSWYILLMHWERWFIDWWWWCHKMKWPLASFNYELLCLAVCTYNASPCLVSIRPTFSGRNSFYCKSIQCCTHTTQTHIIYIILLHHIAMISMGLVESTSFGM